MKRLCFMCHKPTGSTNVRCKGCQRTKELHDEVLEAKRRDLIKRGFVFAPVTTIRNRPKPHV